MTDNDTFVSSSLEGGYSRDLVKVNKIQDLKAAQQARKLGTRDAGLGKKTVFGILLTDGSSGRRDSREKRARMQDQALVSREPVFCVAQ